MAIDLTATPQATTETRIHYVDFSNDLPSGVTVTNVTAGTGAFPLSGTAGLSAGTINAGTGYIQITNPSTAGLFDVRGTAILSDSETIVFMLHVPVLWASVRAGMVDLIADLRAMTDTGYEDYKVAGVYYWSDKHLQDYLDRYRFDFIEAELQPIQQYSNGTTYYLDYRSQYGNLESVASGTGVFKLDNAGGTNQATSTWSADYRRGIITFTSDTAGSSMFLTGRSYDMNAAAADIWRNKAANAAKMYSFSAGGQSFQRNQFMANCIQMAQFYEGMSGPTIISLYRGDNDPVGVGV
jgi:hypothetical protein